MIKVFATIATGIFAYVLSTAFLPTVTFFTVAGFSITLAWVLGGTMAYMTAKAIK